MDKPPIICYWRENTFFVLLQENIKYSIYWLFQRISKKVKFESVVEYRGFDSIYYVAESDGGQDEKNPLFWLATRAHLARLGFPSSVPQGKIIFSAI